MINNLIEKVIGFTKQHNPEIVVGLGVAGMITSTALAVKATPKAMQLIEDKKSELGVTYLTRKEIAEATWKQYIPAVGVGAVSIACIVLGTTKNIKRNTALATVYAISENTLKEYKAKTREIVGEEKAREIDTEVAKSRARSRSIDNPVVIETRDSEYVINTGNGDTLIYDSFSGRYFRSSVNAVESAVNNVNKSLLNDYFITVNEFYNELCIPTIGAGSLIGWKSDKEMVEIYFDSDIDSNGNPYLILSYRNIPVPLYEYGRNW